MIAAEKKLLVFSNVYRFNLLINFSSAKLGMVTFKLGSISMARFIAKLASLFLAQLLLAYSIIYIPKQHVRYLFFRIGRPSNSHPNPPFITSPQPTPPPLCMETQVAPLKLSPITFCMAISAVNCEPS